MIYDDYLTYQSDYEKKYGDKTLVLMEVGSFFEIYAIDNQDEKVGPDIQRVCDLLNLQLSRKNKNILENSRANPLMAGFPSHILSKHTQTLLQNQYTVVLIRQTTQPPNPKREVTEILSPSMQSTPTTLEGNYLMVYYWDVYKDTFQKKYLSVGLAGIDVSTGETFVYEIPSTPTDPSKALDEAVRCFQTYQPRELVLLGSDDLTQEDQKIIEGAIFDYSRPFHKMWSLNPEYHKISYQTALLRRAYPTTGLLSPIDALDLEKTMNARLAFTYMIQFAYEHDSRLIEHLHTPRHLTCDNSCTLEYNTAVQLNVVGSGQSGERPLMSILNRCATAFGSRLFRERLLQPLSDIATLNKRYQEIENVLPTYEQKHSHLKRVMDLERMTRRMLIGSFSPTDWNGLHNSLEAIKDAQIESEELREIIGLIQNDYTRALDLNECSRYLIGEIKGTVFKEGYSSDIDSLQLEYKTAWDKLTNLAEEIEKNGGDSCKIDCSDRDGYSLTLTKKRWESVDKTALSVKSIQAKPISPSSSTVRLKHSWIDEKSNCILKVQSLLGERVTELYKLYVKDFINKHRENLEFITRIVAEIDVICTNAKNATEYRLNRPNLEEGSTSQVRAHKMRHPILERLLQDTMYIPNDIDLSEKRGLLLFGMNASGKSSLMKAIGLNILMAQSGMYVAASSLHLVPYKHILTRITSQDNIYKGLSTFAVEMTELRNILQRCDQKSLVLGDELCAGTESVSALAIVSAGIETLSKKQSSFVFATHLHDLSNMQRITSLPSITLAHMHVEIDPMTGRIIYDRQLRPGSGSALYGLEVCKGLGLPHDFLKIAHEVRCEIQGKSSDFQSTKKSRYNSRVFVQECGVCGANATETHHIREQQTATDKGFVDHFHKNKKFNLVPLCEKCHLKVHHGDLTIHGYVATSEGTTLHYT